MKKRMDSFLNILYPRCCPVCHRILKDQKSLACPACPSKLKRISGSYCMKCGRPVGRETEYCTDCMDRERLFTKGRGIYVYDSVMKASLIQYKYYGRREYGDFYGEAMCRYAKREILEWKPDLIVPAPLHKKKQRLRGFNQAEYLAEKIGGSYGIPVSSGILQKVRDTKFQKKLDAASRRRNLESAFCVKESLKGLDILVIDDVYTTGSTIEAAAGCLKSRGAEKVYFLTLCMGLSEEIAVSV